MVQGRVTLLKVKPLADHSQAFSSTSCGSGKYETSIATKRTGVLVFPSLEHLCRFNRTGTSISACIYLSETFDHCLAKQLKAVVEIIGEVKPDERRYCTVGGAKFLAIWGDKERVPKCLGKKVRFRWAFGYIVDGGRESLSSLERGRCNMFKANPPLPYWLFDQLYNVMEWLFKMGLVLRR